MSFLEMNDLANSTSFRARVTACIVVVAAEFGGYDTPITSETATMRSVKRKSLASNVLRDPGSQINAFIWPVVADESIAADGMNSSDDALRARVEAVWDMVAGVTDADLVPEDADPIAFTFDAQGLLVNFVATPRVDVIGWQWDFGDGMGASTRNTSHRYLAAGDYVVSLTITDSSGMRATSSTVSVSAS